MLGERGLIAFLLEDDESADAAGEDTPLHLESVLSLRREERGGSDGRGRCASAYTRLSGARGRDRLIGLDGQPYGVVLDGGVVSVISDDGEAAQTGWLLDCGVCLLSCAIPAPEAVRSCLGSRYLRAG
jgi:hypothetical protein